MARKLISTRNPTMIRTKRRRFVEELIFRDNDAIFLPLSTFYRLGVKKQKKSDDGYIIDQIPTINYPPLKGDKMIA
jgi:hypothetical protein